MTHDFCRAQFSTKHSWIPHTHLCVMLMPHFSYLMLISYNVYVCVLDTSSSSLMIPSLFSAPLILENRLVNTVAQQLPFVNLAKNKITSLAGATFGSSIK